MRSFVYTRVNSTPAPGWLRARTGSYNSSYGFLSVVALLASVPWVVDAVRRRRKAPRRTTTELDLVEHEATAS